MLELLEKLYFYLIGPEILATVAAVVAKAPGAVDERLLAQPHQLTRSQEQSALKASNLANNSDDLCWKITYSTLEKD